LALAYYLLAAATCCPLCFDALRERLQESLVRQLNHRRFALLPIDGGEHVVDRGLKQMPAEFDDVSDGVSSRADRKGGQVICRNSSRWFMLQFVLDPVTGTET